MPLVLLCVPPHTSDASARPSSITDEALLWGNDSRSPSRIFSKLCLVGELARLPTARQGWLSCYKCLSQPQGPRDLLRCAKLRHLLTTQDLAPRKPLWDDFLSVVCLWPIVSVSIQSSASTQNYSPHQSLSWSQPLENAIASEILAQAFPE